MCCLTQTRGRLSPHFNSEAVGTPYPRLAAAHLNAEHRNTIADRDVGVRQITTNSSLRSLAIARAMRSGMVHRTFFASTIAIVNTRMATPSQTHLQIFSSMEILTGSPSGPGAHRPFNPLSVKSCCKSNFFSAGSILVRSMATDSAASRLGRRCAEARVDFQFSAGTPP